MICCSTSSGESDGAVVLICTITGVVSGKASMSMYCSDHAPATMISDDRHEHNALDSAARSR